MLEQERPFQQILTCALLEIQRIVSCLIGLKNLERLTVLILMSKIVTYQFFTWMKKNLMELSECYIEKRIMKTILKSLNLCYTSVLYSIKDMLQFTLVVEISLGMLTHNQSNFLVENIFHLSVHQLFKMKKILKNFRGK